MQNPFGPNRIEYESRPILWFSKKSETISKAAKPIFVAGTRGSGKTSILRSMSTVHILEDRNLTSQIGKLSWYGVFFQLNETFSPLIDNAVLSLVPEHIRLDPDALRNRQFVIFSHYLELKIVERILDTLSQLRRENHLQYTATDDRRIALDIQRDILHFLPLPAKTDFFGLQELRSLISKYIDACFNAFFHGNDSGKTMFFATDPGTLVNRVVSAVTPLVKGSAFSNTNSRPLFFKILIDDCEALSPDQQQFLNTIIRKTRGDIKWVLAYIGGLYDTIRTVIPGQSLSNADRDVENLDLASEKDFASLCENVASLRLYYGLSDEQRSKLNRDDPLKAFSLTNRLGKLSVNQIIEKVIESGYSDGRQRLIQLAERARNFLTVNISKAQQAQFTSMSKVRPYVEGLALNLMDENSLRKPFNASEASVLKRVIARKQAWAFLEACRILRLHDYPYIGYQIIIQLSDGCIRDFLDIMGEIYSRSVPEASATPRRMFEFVNSDAEIPIDIQRQAVNRASEKKLQGLESISQPFEEESVKMVKALGRLTSRLQTDAIEEEAPSTIEKGLFRINRTEMRELANRLEMPENKIDEVLKRAEKDGFIREVSTQGKFAPEGVGADSAEVVLRLHRRFAPHFKYSYRGPYETSVIPAARIVDLLFSRGLTPEDWADQVFKDLTPPPGRYDEMQPSLFDGEGK
jgi:DNA-binding Lrp family transcriptional regulator